LLLAALWWNCWLFYVDCTGRGLECFVQRHKPRVTFIGLGGGIFYCALETAKDVLLSKQIPHEVNSRHAPPWNMWCCPRLLQAFGQFAGSVLSDVALVRQAHFQAAFDRSCLTQDGVTLFRNSVRERSLVLFVSEVPNISSSRWAKWRKWYQ